MAWSCSQQFESQVREQASDDANTAFTTYFGLSESSNLTTEAINESPDSLLADNRHTTSGSSPWTVRSNMSFIKTETDNIYGEVAYGWDNRGSYTLCVATRPFSNLDENGD